jgi:hypothetical protein
MTRRRERSNRMNATTNLVAVHRLMGLPSCQPIGKVR